MAFFGADDCSVPCSIFANGYTIPLFHLLFPSKTEFWGGDWQGVKLTIPLRDRVWKILNVNIKLLLTISFLKPFFFPKQKSVFFSSEYWTHHYQRNSAMDAHSLPIFPFYLNIHQIESNNAGKHWHVHTDPLPLFWWITDGNRKRLSFP